MQDRLINHVEEIHLSKGTSNNSLETYRQYFHNSQHFHDFAGKKNDTNSCTIILTHIQQLQHTKNRVCTDI